MKRNLHQSGFTLIELIVVIVIVSLISVGTFEFIGNSTQGAVDLADRQERARAANVIIERVSRDIRSSLPNSVRVNSANTCLELVPVKAGTNHLNAPITPVLSDAIDVVPFVSFGASDIDSGVDRLALFPNTSGQIYNLGTPATISDTVDDLVSPGGIAGSVRINLDGDHAFVTDSPTARIFVVSEPIRYCFVGNQLIRYSAYGFEANIESALSSPGTSVVGSEIESGSFNYSPGSLSRSAVAVIDLAISESDSVTDQDHSIRQEVHIRNVP